MSDKKLQLKIQAMKHILAKRRRRIHYQDRQIELLLCLATDAITELEMSESNPEVMTTVSELLIRLARLTPKEL